MRLRYCKTKKFSFSNIFPDNVLSFVTILHRSGASKTVTSHMVITQWNYVWWCNSNITYICSLTSNHFIDWYTGRCCYCSFWCGKTNSRVEVPVKRFLEHEKGKVLLNLHCFIQKCKLLMYFVEPKMHIKHIDEEP